MSNQDIHVLVEFHKSFLANLVEDDELYKKTAKSIGKERLAAWFKAYYGRSPKSSYTAWMIVRDLCSAVETIHRTYKRVGRHSPFQ